jgi:hypothetical protein
VAWYMFVWYMATTSRLSVGAQSLGDDNRHEEDEEEEKQGVQHTRRSEEDREGDDQRRPIDNIHACSASRALLASFPP